MTEEEDLMQRPWSGSGTPTTPARLIDHYQEGSFISTPELEREREENKKRLKSRFEQIFEKYEHDFTGIGDEIDLETGEVIVDNGHIARMKHEADPGTGKSTEDRDMIVDAECSTSEDEDTPYDSDDFTEISNEEDEDDEEDESASRAEVSFENLDTRFQADLSTTASAMHELSSSIDRSLKTVPNTIQNSDLSPPDKQCVQRSIDSPQDSTTESTASLLPFDLLDHLPSLQQSIHDMKSRSQAGHVIDQDAIEALSRSIADQLVESLETNKQSNKRKRSRGWEYPALPMEKRPRTRKPSVTVLDLETHPHKPTHEDKPSKKTSIWAVTGPTRKSRKPVPFLGTSEATSQLQSNQSSEGKQCSNCQITFTISWRNSQYGILCNPCWMFYYRYGGMRPARSPSPSIHESEFETKRYRANTSRRVASSGYATFTPIEDAMIIKLKEIDALTWENIALHFPQRSAYALQNRYSKTLAGRPTTGRDTLIEQGFPTDRNGSMMPRKGRFSRSEDTELVRLRLENKLSWSQIAARFAGSNAETVEERFNALTNVGTDQNRVSNNGLKGTTPVASLKQPRFSVEEDQQVLKLRETDGLGWAEIATYFPGRSAGALQKRYTRKLVHGGTKLAADSVKMLSKDTETRDFVYSAAEDAKLLRSGDVDRMSWDSICKLFPQEERRSVISRYRYLQRTAEDNIASASQAVLNHAITLNQQPEDVHNKLPSAISSHEVTVDASDIKSNAFSPWYSGQHVTVTRKMYSDEEDGLILMLKSQGLKWEHIQLYMPSRTVSSLLSRYRELRRMPRPRNAGTERSMDVQAPASSCFELVAESTESQDNADMAATQGIQHCAHNYSAGEPVQPAAEGAHDCIEQKAVSSTVPRWPYIFPADEFTAPQGVAHDKGANKVAPLRPLFSQHVNQGSRKITLQGINSMPIETGYGVCSMTKDESPVTHERSVPPKNSEAAIVLNSHLALVIDPTIGSRDATPTDIRANTFMEKRIAALPPEIDISKEVDQSNVAHLSRRSPLRCTSPVTNSTPASTQTYITPTRHGANGLPYYVAPQFHHDTPVAYVPISCAADTDQEAEGPVIGPFLSSTQHVNQSEAQRSDFEQSDRHAGLPYRAASKSSGCCPSPVEVRNSRSLVTVDIGGNEPAAPKRSIYLRGSTESESELDDNHDELHELKPRRCVNRQELKRTTMMSSRCSTADPEDPDFVVGSESEQSDDDVADLDGKESAEKEVTTRESSKIMPNDRRLSKSSFASEPDRTRCMHLHVSDVNSDGNPAVVGTAEGSFNAFNESEDSMQVGHRLKKRSATSTSLTCPMEGMHDTSQGQPPKDRPQLTADCRDAYSRTSDEYNPSKVGTSSSDVQLVPICRPISNSITSSKNWAIRTSSSSPSVSNKRERGKEQETSTRGKPAYTTTELAIIALLSTPKHQMTNEAMFEWLGEEFPYVRTPKAVPNFEILKRNIRTRLNSSKYFGSVKGPHGKMIRKLRSEAYQDILDKKLKVAPYNAQLLPPEVSTGESEDVESVQLLGQMPNVRSPPGDISNTTTSLADKGDASGSNRAAQKPPSKSVQPSPPAESSSSRTKHRVFDSPDQQEATTVTSGVMHNPSRSTPLQSRLPQTASEEAIKESESVQSHSSPLSALSKDRQGLGSVYGKLTPSTRAKKPAFKPPVASSLMTPTLYDRRFRSNSVVLPGSSRRVVCTPAPKREISDSEDELAL